MNICICAIVKSEAGKAIDLRPFLIDLVNASRMEKACIQYDIYQSLDDEDLFIINQEWEDEVWFREHVRQIHVLDFISASRSMLAEKITIHRTVKLS